LLQLVTELFSSCYFLGTKFLIVLKRISLGLNKHFFISLVCTDLAPPPNSYLAVAAAAASGGGTSPASADSQSVASAFVAALASSGLAGKFRRRQHSRDSIASYENLMKKKESRLTRIAISIVWLFIFCHAWKLVPTVYELIYSEVSEIIRNFGFSWLSTFGGRKVNGGYHTPSKS
jgi:hypothetical protein